MVPICPVGPKNADFIKEIRNKINRFSKFIKSEHKYRHNLSSNVTRILTWTDQIFDLDRSVSVLILVREFDLDKSVTFHKMNT